MTTWPYFPELLATPVPRYTSFPTAAEFGTVTADDFAEAAGRVTGAISLYVHIPFCEKICWYCGCNTAASNRTERLQSYLAALHSEIVLVSRMLPPGTRVSRVAFGGGSPNAVPPIEFVRLFQELLLNFDIAEADVSIELDPRTLNEDWTSVLRGINATHASLGVQTLSQGLQKAIGRVQPRALIERSVSLLREAGVGSLNFDLMYGLPGQTDADLDDSLEAAATLGADRIALFGYAHVPHMIPRQRKIDATELPGQDTRFAMAQRGYERLCAAGYEPVGFDHFARPSDGLARAARQGTLRRNFQGFTDDQASVLIGLGATAISSFPGLLAQNEKNAGRYRMLLSQSKHSAARGIRRSVADQHNGAIIEALLCQGRTALDPVIAQRALARLMPYLDAGVCRFEHGALSIADHGLPYARSIAACFDPYRAITATRFSSAI